MERQTEMKDEIQTTTEPEGVMVKLGTKHFTCDCVYSVHDLLVSQDDLWEQTPAYVYCTTAQRMYPTAWKPLQSVQYFRACTYITSKTYFL